MEPKYNIINFDKLMKHSNWKTLSLAQPCPPLRLSPSAHQRRICIASSLEVASRPYITVGDPDFATIAEALKVLDACGSDIIELGVPYFDPLADGPVIQAAATRSLARGTNSNKILAMLKEGEVEDKLTCMSAVCLYNLGYQKLHAMYAKNSYNFDCNFATEKRKDEAGTSKGKERMEGEGEGEDEDPRSLPKEELRDDELLTPIPRAEGRECDSARAEGREGYSARAEGRERNSARREQKWFERLGSGVINFGKFAAPYVLTYLLYDNAVKKFDGIALQIKAANEAKVGTTGSASPVSFNLNNMFNVSISPSPRMAWNNSENRGNDVEVSGSK